MFFDAEHGAALLEPHAQADVESLGFVGRFRVESILYVASFEFAVCFDVDVGFDEIGVEFFNAVEASAQVHHGTDVAVAVGEVERGHSCGFAYAKVVGAECAGYVYYAGTVVGGHVVAGDHTESAFTRIYPGEELNVMQAGKFRTGDCGHNFVWNEFVSFGIV